MILFLSDLSDAHTKVVSRVLAERGMEPVLFHFSSFPQRSHLTLRDGDLARGELRVPGHGRIPLEAIEAVWNRRPGLFEPSPAVHDAEHKRFVYEECYEAFSGLWRSLPARWMNRPDRDLVAGHKTYQLALARRLGLSLPRTCVTNDPGAAREFVTSCGDRRVVFKSQSTSAATWRPTRFVNADGLERVELVKHAPVTFQEYVPGVDLRVTAVDGELFPAAIDARETSLPHDFRPVYEHARVSPCELPSEVADRLRSLVAELGLVYSAIDLRRREDGEHVFLEANPSGQWLFVERRTGQPITRAVAGYLAGPAAEGSGRKASP